MSSSTESTFSARTIWRRMQRLGSPALLYDFAARWGGRCGVVSAAVFALGLYYALVVAPPDYQMGDSYRIIFIHVPAAWMSLSVYVIMALAAGSGLVWRLKVGAAVARAAAPLGAMFTFCALVTGALWGKPTWGTYWVWDARLTSELLLLFLYLGYIALVSSFDDRRRAANAAALLAVVGLVNLPIIHYSVQWWNTLHQGPTVAKLGRPSIDIRMLIPLLMMFVAFNLYFIAALLGRLKLELLRSECGTRWVAALVEGSAVEARAVATEVAAAKHRGG